MYKLKLEGNKYTVYYDLGKLYAHRHGEAWRDMTGDKLIGNLVDKVEALSLPKSYDAATFISQPLPNEDGRCAKATFYFKDMSQAEAWFDAITQHYDEQKDDDVPVGEDQTDAG